MVVRLRLARWGCRNNPHYGIVATNHRSPRDGRFLEHLGSYDPTPRSDGTGKHTEINIERAKYWIGVGAQPSNRVAWLLAKIGLVPESPKMLQKRGFYNVVDSQTWPVAIVGEDGCDIELTTRQIAEMRYPSLVQTLPAPKVIVPRIKQAPSFPRTPIDALATLKKISGIY